MSAAPIISANVPRLATYTAASGQAEFPIPYAYFSQTDNRVEVRRDGQLVAAYAGGDGDMTCTPAANAPLFSGVAGMATIPACVLGDIVTVYADTTPERSVMFRNPADMTRDNLNADANRRVAVEVELKRDSDRAIKVAPGQSGQVLPLPPSAQQFMAVTPDGDIVYTNGPELAAVTAGYLVGGDYEATGDGATVAFILPAKGASNPQHLDIHVDGVTQKFSDYSVSLDTLTLDSTVFFDDPPARGAKIAFRPRVYPNGQSVIPDIGVALVIATGETTPKSLANRFASAAIAVDTYTALGSEETRSNKTVLCLGRNAVGSGGGFFRFLAGTQTALVASDPQKFIYVAPTASPTGSAGCWVRQCNTTEIDLDWGGAAGDGVTDDSAVFKAAWLFLLKQGGGVCNLSGKTYRWSSAQEFAFLVRSGSAGAATGYKGAGNGNNQATSAGVNLSFKGGVTFRGQGSGSGDSVFNDDGATIIDFNVNTALRMISVYNVRFERMAMRNIANLSAADGKVIHITSYDSPVDTTYQVHFKEIAFLDDSFEVTAVTTGITDAFVVIENAKMTIFEGCTFYKQGNAVRLGGEAVDHPSALLKGEADAVVFRNCQIAGDIVLTNTRQLKLDNSEFWPLDPNTTAAGGVSGVGAIIKPVGTGFFDTITLLDCKASYDGNGTRTFLKTVAGLDGGSINVIGGIYGDYDTLFEHNGAGNLVVMAKLRQLAAGKKDIVLGATFTGNWVDLSEYLFTDGGSGTHLTDNRPAFAAGSATARNFAASQGIPIVFYMDGRSVSSTNTTSEEILRTISFPGKLLGNFGCIEIDTCWSVTNSANQKTPRIRIGAAGAGLSGSTIMNVALTTSASYRSLMNIQNRGAQNSQITHSAATPVSQTNTSAQTAAINTANPWELAICSLKADGTETLRLEYVKISILRRDVP